MVMVDIGFKKYFDRWPSLAYCTFTLAKDVGCKINFRTTEDPAGKSKAWRFFDLVIKFDSMTE